MAATISTRLDSKPEIRPFASIYQPHALGNADSLGTWLGVAVEG